MITPQGNWILNKVRAKKLSKFIKIRLNRDFIGKLKGELSKMEKISSIEYCSRCYLPNAFYEHKKNGCICLECGSENSNVKSNTCSYLLFLNNI